MSTQPLNGHAIAKRPPTTELTEYTPADLLRIAVTQGADIEKLSRLMDLQERWERNEARKAYTTAINAFKAESPRIAKNTHVKFGATDYKHASLDHVCDAVIGGLSKHGISHRWKVEQANGEIRVTCVLTHAAGHSEETTLSGAPDQTGSKNSIQAVGSTVTYLSRYTLLCATGLATADSDTDGRTAAPESTRVQELLGEISRAQDVDQLWKIYKFAYREAYAQGDHAAMAVFITAKDRRKAELQ